jgi:hypothetical protein
LAPLSQGNSFFVTPSYLFRGTVIAGGVLAGLGHYYRLSKAQKIVKDSKATQ